MDGFDEWWEVHERDSLNMSEYHMTREAWYAGMRHAFKCASEAMGEFADKLADQASEE